MSFLGKILVVVQVVLTILFMAFAGAVSATHTSWKQAHENVTKQLADKEQQLRAEEARAKAEKLELETKLSSATEAAALKDADNRDLKSRLDTLTAEYDQVKTAAAVKTQLASIAADDNEARQEEATRLREVAQNRLKSYEVVVDELKKSKDEANELAKNVASLKTNYETAMKDKAILEQILVANKLSTDPNSYASLRPAPPLLQGKVLETSKNRLGRSELIAISLGSDDGLNKGDHLGVYRSGLAKTDSPQYLGKIEIVSLEPDKAVGMMIDKTKNSLIQEGDNVTTGL